MECKRPRMVSTSLAKFGTVQFSHIFLPKISFYNKYHQYVRAIEKDEGMYGYRDDDRVSGVPLHRLANKGSFSES